MEAGILPVLTKSGAYDGAPLVGAPQDRWVRNGLLVIADAAAQITHLGDETYLRDRFDGLI